MSTLQQWTLNRWSAGTHTPERFANTLANRSHSAHVRAKETPKMLFVQRLLPSSAVHDSKQMGGHNNHFPGLSWPNPNLTMTVGILVASDGARHQIHQSLALPRLGILVR